jgi:hypothetical protein
MGGEKTLALRARRFENKVSRLGFGAAALVLARQMRNKIVAFLPKM